MADVSGRLNIALNRRSTERVDCFVTKHELTKTAVIERALAIMEIIDEMDEQGGVYSKDKDGKMVRTRFL